MQTIEYRTVDKSGWSDGPWQSEPDKRQWQDEETGLPCLIVRGPAGALCGYVGVSPEHPWHGKGYSACVSPSRHEDHEGDDEGYHYNCTPCGVVSVHGGLTFAKGCADMSVDRWNAMRAKIPEMQAEAARHPRGDAARWLTEWLPALDNHDAWRTQMEQQSICHLPEPGEPDGVWWFGFDCAHSGDLSPLREYEPLFNDGAYRDIDYVTGEVQSLAKQLHAIAA